MFAVGLAVALIAGACGGGGKSGESARGVVPTTVADEGTPVDGGSINVGLEAESAGWQPCVDSHSEAGTMVMMAIYDPLMSRTATGKIEPFLAQSLTPNADLTQWTLKLRPNVKFADGTPLNASVLKDNFDNGIKAPTSRCASAAKPITEMKVVDDLTVTYVLSGPFGPFPDLLVLDMGMPWSPQNAQKWGKDVSAHPVGTGPFMFDSWERDSKLIVKKNPNYWRKGFPHLDQVTFRPIPDEDARLASLKTGELDISHTLRQEFVKQARDAGDSIKRYEFIGNNTGSTIFNVASPPVDDVRIRKAFAYSLNQDALVQVLGGAGISPTATQYFSKDSPWYSAKVAAAWPTNDPAKGKELVQSYMNDPKRSDGKKVGDPVTFQYNCPPDPSLIALAQAYQEQAKAVGLQLDLKQVEQATHINNAVGSPPYTTANFQAACWRLGGQADPDAILFNSFSDPNGNAANVTNFSTPELQQALKAGRESADFKTRYDAYEKVMSIFADQVPATYTGYTATAALTQPKVRGLLTWTLPDGAKGTGVEQSVVLMWNVWLAK
ncbi:MAG TPA: ABC transporter substrate-binding protein [Acidimicrobiales bacterium]|nr:ABC transporter substrate-binding protein [Acidimicrobiales bacterium]